MASIAAAWALGLDWSIIEMGLATFVNDAQTAPGRFNVFDYRGATVIADYGHNPDAILALIQAIETIPANKRMVVISGAGDRRDEDIIQQTEILGESFDQAILYQDQCQRGREDGEVLALLQLGLKNASRTKEIVEIDYKKNVMAGMQWTKEWIKEAEEPNREFMFLIEKDKKPNNKGCCEG
jgi:cyanophycin synthetase